MNIEYEHDYDGTIFLVSGDYYPGHPGSYFQPPDPTEIEFECEGLASVVRRTWTYYDFCEFVPSAKWHTYAEMVEYEAECLRDAICKEIERRYADLLESSEEDRAEAELERRRLCD